MKCLFCVFVDHVGDADCGDDLQKIGRNAFEESFDAFILYCLLRNINYTRVGWRVKDSPMIDQQIVLQYWSFQIVGVRITQGNVRKGKLTLELEVSFAED